jgi:hypothetical protein
LICIPLKAREDEHFFMYLLAIFTSSPIFNMFHSVSQAFNWGFYFGYWAVHFKLFVLQNFYILIPLFILHKELYEFSLSYFGCVFMFLHSDTSLCVSSLSSLIILSIIFEIQ